jgi:hypothetical protein
MKKLLLATVALLTMTMAASADIALKLSQDGGAVVPDSITLAPGQTSFSATNQTFGAFFFTNISGSTVGSTVSPVVLTSNQIAAQTTDPAPHTLDVWFTAQNLGGLTPPTQPFGIQDLLSSFSLSQLTGNGIPATFWTATLQTLYDVGNGLFTGTEIAHANFTGQGTIAQSSNTPSPNFDLGTGKYSLTAHYTIHTTGIGQANTTISLAVPGPLAGAGIPGLLTACFGLFGLNRWRRRRQSA